MPSSRPRVRAACRKMLEFAAPFLVLAAIPFLVLTAVGAAGPPVFINEIHYDNVGTDAGEFIEIAGPAGTDLTGWSIVLYNGSGGASYDTDALSGTIPDQQSGFGAVSISYPSNGIQNGAPDGIALVDASSNVVQFLSYEGSFTATGGPANGMTSVDIGVSQPGSEAAGLSLQLQGTGSGYGDFTWSTASIANTQNAVNTGQTFSDIAPSPSPSPSPTPTPTPTPEPAVSDVVVSQVYGGGGNSGATLRNDFIELFNRGDAVVDLAGWSVQAASATGGTWNVTELTGTILPGGYYLVQQAAGTGGTEDLPDPDAEGTIALGSTSGKVALANSITALAGTCPVSVSLLDLVGYGGTANCFEGAGRAPAPSNTTADLRSRGGCQDTNDNAVDFSTGSPFPRNRAYPPRDCTSVPRTIPEIQGAGSVSPFVNTEVATTGIVTAIHQRFAGGTYIVDGFYLQSDVGDATSPDSDSDPATSEGVFVFTNSVPTAVSGDNVTLSGGVAESFGLTQINTTNDQVTVSSTGHALPPAFLLTTTELSPAGGVEQLERFEAMRVAAGPLTTIAPTNTFGEIDTVLAGTPRAFREPGVDVSDPLPPGAPCCVPRFDENPERLMLDMDGRPGSTIPVLTSGVTLGAVQGPLDYSFGRYKVLPDAAPSASTNASATPVPAPLPGELTIASTNLLNFFIANADFPSRVGKASLALRTVLHSPDVIGVEECGDLASLQALADRLNTDTVSGGGANPLYQAYLVESDDDTEQDIDVGFLVKASRVNVVSVTQEGRDTTYINPINLQEELLNDRAPLVLRATAGPVSPSNAFTVVVNHLRSLIDVEQDPGDGPRVREKRRKQAEFLAGLLQSLQAENVVSMGDYNAFQFNDGYVDVLGTVKGQPAPNDQVVASSPDLVAPDLTNLIETALVPADQKYSYVFEGNAQALDHVLVNANMLPRVTRFAFARNNADFPTAFASDFTRPERISDHDHPVAYLSLAPASLIFADGFESGGFSAWSSAVIDGGDLSVAAAAALNGTVFGMRGVVDRRAAYVQDDSPVAESRYRARFYLDPSGFRAGPRVRAARTPVFAAFTESASGALVSVVLRVSDGQHAIRAQVSRDGRLPARTAIVPIAPGPHAVEIDWRRATGPDANDGSFELWIDGVSVATLTGLDNSLRAVDSIRLGALNALSPAAGAVAIDEFVSQREGYIGP